jgi:hypothetical protein
MTFLSGLLPHIEVLPRVQSRVQWHAASQVGQAEARTAVTPECRTKERVERLILVDGENLAVARRPAAGREVEPEYRYLSQEWL